MDVEGDPNLVVVNLEHCVSSEGAHLGKNSCIYTTTVPTNSCHEMLQLATPVQCLSDINQSISRIHQHQQLAQLQPLQYPQVQVNYENSSSPGLQQGSSILPPSSMYQSSTIHYSQPPSFLTPLPPQPLHILESALAPDPTEQEISDIANISLNTPLDVPAEECAYPADDFSYYKEIENYLAKEQLPLRASELYIKNLKARAKHYVINDGVLHHNPKNPRRVVMTQEEQKRLLENAHLVRATGIHQGIKKMLSVLHEKCFWRGMYVAVANFVKKCDGCRDDARPSGNTLGKDPPKGCAEENETLSVKSQTCSPVWDEVEISVHGPFKVTTGRNEYIVIIADPTSCFVVGAPITQHGQCTKVTQFMLHTFYTFGFPFSRVSVPANLFEAINTEMNWRLKGKKNALKIVEQKDEHKLPWVTQLVSLFVKRHPSKWDKELDYFLYQFRTDGMKQLNVKLQASPFYAMFNRKHCAESLERNKENVSRGNSKALRNSRPVWQCRKCRESFASRISYRFHMKHHRKKTEGSETVKTTGTTPVEENVECLGALEGCVENTVSAVKAVLDETKNERRKRGKYHKYSAELQQEMAVYASQHGSSRAAEHFSKVLGTKVSDSTIRNMLKSHCQFLPSVKEEIARYAANHGVNRAVAHFADKLNRNISASMVRRFKAQYWTNSSNDQSKSALPSVASIKQTDVKTGIELQASPRQDQTLDVTQGFNHQPITCPTTACFAQPNSIATLAQSNTGYSFQNMQVVTSAFAPHPSQQLRRDDRDGLIAQHFLLVTPDVGQGSFEMSMQSDKPDDKGNQVCLSEYQTFQVDPQKLINACPDLLSPKVEVIQPVPDENEPCEQANYTQSANDLKKSHKAKKENEGKKKRGSYCTYSPELRAEIGKYAAEHGCIRASKHFSEVLGYDVAESTARALKQKYLQKVKHSDVTSLGFSQRGRPLRLGKYDEVVQECLKELFRSGEKVTSFLAITTAKEVLNKFEPELLEENGGTVILNTSWAKSFLKRIGPGYTDQMQQVFILETMFLQQPNESGRVDSASSSYFGESLRFAPGLSKNLREETITVVGKRKKRG